MLKTVSSITNAIGAVNYKGVWNANTNSPALASGVGTKGDYYVVGTAGTTSIDGISTWGVGDWIVFNGTAWQRLDGGSNGEFVDLTTTGEAAFNKPTGKVYRANNGKFHIRDSRTITAATNFAEIDFGADPGVAIVNVVYTGTANGYDLTRFLAQWTIDRSSSEVITITERFSQGSAAMVSATASGSKVIFGYVYRADPAGTNQRASTEFEILCTAGANVTNTAVVNVL
jgi:hypothetical protein